VRQNSQKMTELSDNEMFQEIKNKHFYMDKQTQLKLLDEANKRSKKLFEYQKVQNNKLGLECKWVYTREELQFRTD